MPSHSSLFGIFMPVKGSYACMAINYYNVLVQLVHEEGSSSRAYVNPLSFRKLPKCPLKMFIESQAIMLSGNACHRLTILCVKENFQQSNLQLFLNNFNLHPCACVPVTKKLIWVYIFKSFQNFKLVNQITSYSSCDQDCQLENL
jgi:hypothetical protein